MPTLPPRAPFLDQLIANLDEVRLLLEIHTKVAGEGRGRKYDVEVLNKSAIVLLVACWEAFVEDLAEAALGKLIDAASSHTVLPEVVLERIGSKNSGRNAWNLAGDGWKTAVRSNLKEVLAKTTGALNTPRTAQVDELFDKVLGLASLSSCWQWPSRTCEQSRRTLDDLITLRGSIAHRVKHSESVRKRDVVVANDFVGRLAEKSSNRVRLFLRERTGADPWRPIKYHPRAQNGAA